MLSDTFVLHTGLHGSVHVLRSSTTRCQRAMLLVHLSPKAQQGLSRPIVCCDRAAGYETIMMNSNPETVSTDYDTSSRLYFEPLTVEDVLNVLEAERPDGIIVQFGGQTPLKLASGLQAELKRNPIPTASGAAFRSHRNP